VTTTNLGTSTTYFVNSYYELTGGSVITKYYYAGGQRIAMLKDGVLNYILSDHLGSTSIITDASGNVVSQQGYKAWGEVRTAAGNSPTNYTYTGQYSDSYINLLDYGSRRYDPELGRFIQPDSIVPDPSNSQAYDRYAYTFNNPVRYTDPSGYCSEEGDDWCYESTIDIAISYIQHSEVGKSLYDTLIKDGYTIEYSNDGAGHIKGSIIQVSKTASPTYIAGTIAHEGAHHIIDADKTLLEEYQAMLTGDIVRDELIQDKYGTSSGMKHPLNVFTVNLNNPDRNSLSSDLKVWFKRYEPLYVTPSQNGGYGVLFPLPRIPNEHVGPR